jgi:MFS family permease
VTNSICVKDLRRPPKCNRFVKDKQCTSCNGNASAQETRSQVVLGVAISSAADANSDAASAAVHEAAADHIRLIELLADKSFSSQEVLLYLRALASPAQVYAARTTPPDLLPFFRSNASFAHGVLGYPTTTECSQSKAVETSRRSVGSRADIDRDLAAAVPLHIFIFINSSCSFLKSFPMSTVASAQMSLLRFCLSKTGLLLLSLYFVQGLPFGFQALTLPLVLRSSGLSLDLISLTSLLSLPWWFKALWAPFVDAYGTRMQWIVPTQLLLALACLVAAMLDFVRDLSLVLGLVFFFNICASTQDVAVDGLAIDILQEHELAFGNTIQIAGYKIGVLFGGGVLAYFSDSFGSQGVFLPMAIVVGVCLIIAISAAPKTVAVRSQPHAPAATDRPAVRLSVSQVFVAMLEALQRPQTRWMLVLFATYKLGETIIDSMFKLFLFDHGVSRAQIGAWSSGFGMPCSILGSCLGSCIICGNDLADFSYLQVATCVYGCDPSARFN